MDRARHGLRALLSLIPETATVSRLRRRRASPPARVRELDLLVVRPGERVATDGVVAPGQQRRHLRGHRRVHPRRGRPRGRRSPPGRSTAPAPLQVEATAGGADNSLARSCSWSSRPTARKGERPGWPTASRGPWSPAVLLLAALVAVFGSSPATPAVDRARPRRSWSPPRPCALAIAVPVTVIPRSAPPAGSASSSSPARRSSARRGPRGGLRQDRHPDPREPAGRRRRDRCRPRPRRRCWPSRPGWRRPAPIRSPRRSSPRPRHRRPRPRSPSHPGQGITGLVAAGPARLGRPRLAHRRATSAASARRQLEARHDRRRGRVAGAPPGLVGIRDELRARGGRGGRALSPRRATDGHAHRRQRRTAAALAARPASRDVRAGLLPADKAAAIEQFGRDGTDRDDRRRRQRRPRPGDRRRRHRHGRARAPTPRSSPPTSRSPARPAPAAASHGPRPPRPRAS